MPHFGSRSNQGFSRSSRGGHRGMGMSHSSFPSSHRGDDPYGRYGDAYAGGSPSAFGGSHRSSRHEQPSMSSYGGSSRQSGSGGGRRDGASAWQPSGRGVSGFDHDWSLNHYGKDCCSRHEAEIDDRLDAYYGEHGFEEPMPGLGRWGRG